THRPDHVPFGALALSARIDAPYFEPGLVERGPHQVVHGDVDDCEAALAVGLQVFDACEQHAGVADDRTTEFEEQFELAAARMAVALLEHRFEQRRAGGRGLVVVEDTESTAE